MNSLLWFLLAVPLGTGAVLACSGPRGDRVAPWAGMGVTAVVLGLAVASAVARPVVGASLFAGIRAGFEVDGLSAALVVTVAGTTSAVLAFAVGEPDLRTGRFVGVMLLFAGAMLVTVTATTLAPLLMGWEVMGATSWVLIGYWWREPRRVRAGHTAFLTTRAADLGLYLAAGAALAGGVGSLALADLTKATSPWLTVVTVGVVLAALGKSAQLPFSFWLSRAMEGPSPVSALLHSATMVAAGAYLLLRLEPVLVASGWGAPTAAWMGAVTALLLGLVAVAQTDLKQLLAASTCAQIAFMVLAAGVGSVTGGTAHLVAHAATKSLLFLAAGAWLTSLGTKQLPALRGALRRHPVVGVTFSVGALTLAGLPPLSLWLTKDTVLAAALEHGPGLYAVGLAAAVVSAVYSLKMCWYVWQPASTPDDGAIEQRPTGRVPTVMLPSLVALAVFTPVIGAFVSSFTREPAPSAGELPLSAALALAAATLTWSWGARRVPVPSGALVRWLDLERVAEAALVRPTLALARVLATLDDRGVDRVVRGVAAGGRAMARLTDRSGELSIDGLVRTIAAGTRGLGRLARRPQTGQLHQYYAQAIAALLLLALVFVLVR